MAGSVERQSVDVFFIVSAEGGNELTGAKIERADHEKLPPVERAAKVQRLSGPMSVREGL